MYVHLYTSKCIHNMVIWNYETHPYNPGKLGIWKAVEIKKEHDVAWYPYEKEWCQMKVETKALPNSSDEESLISTIIESKTVLNLSGIVKRYSSKEYRFKISSDNLELIQLLKTLVKNNLTGIMQIQSHKGYYDKGRF